jgi:hypothetical protein
MKASLLFAFGLILHNICLSQLEDILGNDEAKILNPAYIKYDLVCTEKGNPSIRLPFSKINLFDVRYDTTCIALNWGVNANGQVGFNIQNKKYTLRDGLATGLTNYFNTFYQDNFSENGAEIFCYIKRFSVTVKDTMIDFKSSGENIDNIKFEVECLYKEGDLFFPALRIDTSYSLNVVKARKNFTDLVKEIIQPLIEKLPNIDTVKIFKRTAYTFQQIDDRYQSRFNLPILTTKTYTKGVYQNFREFINNAPSITKYTFKKGVLLDSTGTIISSKIFGFCDGSKCWLFSLGNHVPYGLGYGATFSSGYLTPLVRVSNSFEYFYKIYSYDNSSNAYSVRGSIKFLMMLNMDDGSVN